MQLTPQLGLKCLILTAALLRSSYAGYYRNGYYHASDYDKYDDGYPETNYQMSLDVCSNSVVDVSSMTILCDSPYTFYYGNGAHRNSPICDYGDKATLSVTFRVVDDLQEGDDEIYFTMAAYDDDKNLLTSTYPESLCDDYVGSECTKQGSYSFDLKLKFGTPSGGDRNRFIPYVQMAFSTKGDFGYNLGAVNFECQVWDQDQPVYISWREPKTQQEEAIEFVTSFGMLIGTGVLLCAFAVAINYIYFGSVWCFLNPLLQTQFLYNNHATPDTSNWLKTEPSLA